MIDFIFLLLGIIGLWLGTELVVRSAVTIAHRYNISEIFIGLTILAFGTDLPELVIAVGGALHNAKGMDTSGIITGNAIGSCINQISLVIGATAFFHFLSIGKIQIRYFAIELFGSIILLMIVSFDNVLSWDNGAILIIAFLIYFITHIQQERKSIKRKTDTKTSIKFSKIAMQICILVIGLVLVAFSSDVTINNALHIAEYWGIKQSFIGAIILGAGTSLPELAISVNAVLKKKPGLSIGNIIGSNIFDLLIPLGFASVIADVRVDNIILWFDLPFLFMLSLIVLGFLSSKRGLQKWEGADLLYYILDM